MNGTLKFASDAYNATLTVATGETHAIPVDSTGRTAKYVYTAIDNGSAPAGRGAWMLPAIDIGGTPTTKDGLTAASLNNTNAPMVRERMPAIINVAGFTHFITYPQNGGERFCIAPLESGYREVNGMEPVKLAADSLNATLASAPTASENWAIPTKSNGDPAKFVLLSVDSGLDADDTGGCWFLPAMNILGTPTTVGGATAVTTGTGVYLRDRQTLLVDVSGFSHIMTIGGAGGERFCISPVEV